MAGDTRLRHPDRSPIGQGNDPKAPEIRTAFALEEAGLYWANRQVSPSEEDRNDVRISPIAFERGADDRVDCGNLCVPPSNSGLIADRSPQQVESRTGDPPSGSNHGDRVRWTPQTGLKAVLEDKQGNRYTSSVSYGRRGVTDGSGDNDNGVWLEFSSPL